MLITAILLIVIGALAASLGTGLFKLLLPLLGLITGFFVGFVGFQGVFGTGAVSTAMAIVIALAVGIVMAILSFLFFEIAVVIFAIAAGAMVFSYIGLALGLSQDGFLVFLLGLAGAILAGVYASRYNIGTQLVVTLTSLLGVGYILVGLFLIIGEVSLNDLTETGIVSTLLDVVDQSFLWFFVWVGGALVAMQLQYRILLAAVLPSAFILKESSQKPQKRS